MVYADSFTAANRAADLVKVTWSSGEAANVSEDDLQRRAAELIADPKGGALVVDDPGVDAAFASAKQRLERTYTTSTVMHFALEPINALAFEKDGVFEIHTGNQWQSLILPVLAKALGRSQDKSCCAPTRSAEVRPSPERRLHRAGSARRQGCRQAGQDGVCARGRHALRLPAIALDAGLAHGLRRRRPGNGDGPPCGSRWPTAVMAPSFMPKDATAFRSISSPSMAPTTGTRWEPSGFARCAMISQTGRSGLDGCAPSGQVG